MVLKRVACRDTNNTIRLGEMKDYTTEVYMASYGIPFAVNIKHKTK